MTLKERYQAEILPNLMKELGIDNTMAAPKVTKVTVSVGLSQSIKDPKMLETIEQNLRRITGQAPVKTKAKKSIASFKIREGQIVGIMVTLRGDRMWDFLTRLTQFTFPRIRDFRGISDKTVDAKGNLSIGFRENLAFPEVRSDEVERLHGLQITVSTTAGTRKNGLALFKALGFPFTA
ncbi:50S ribosomal protein L5 [Patescibacteria group bacterium]|jgi:large subunit ribosomal protein L5|nr:50S ribosomal protein L5 [Candidatus Uhrbacteria bacterium]MCK9361192.1 50S ribosomal protein L5 [Patescibacteria group bacterium]